MLDKIKKKIMTVTGIGRVVTNVNNTNYNRNCLIRYINEPFEKGSDDSHQNTVQVIEIAKLIGNLGYNVDVIDYISEYVVLKNKYDAVFDISVCKKPIYINALKNGAKKIAYLTGSNPTFANAAEMDRIRAVRERRGAKLIPRRQAPLMDLKIENFDLVIMIGSRYTLDTYHNFHFRKSAIVPNTGYEFDFKFDKSRKDPYSFLFFGSSGAVHKGLDLLLEVFSEIGHPYKLYVCGNFENEKDFVREYARELYRTSNIFSMGFVDVMSQEFKKLCEECVFTILPSCSEGCAGSIATCMSGGLIPICSRICGYDDNEVIILEDCSKERIRETIQCVSNMKIEDLARKSDEAVNITKTKYSMKNFKEQMEAALREVL